MNRTNWMAIAALPIWVGAVMAAPDNAPSHQSRSSGAHAIGKTNVLHLADLTTQSDATKAPIFIVKNIGSAHAAASVLQIECRTQSTNQPCQPDLHYRNLPSQAVPPPAGTYMTAPHIWRVPVPTLAPAAQMKFALGVWPTASEAAGLKLRACADIASTVAEARENNNCTEFVFLKPN
jgi:hypothetical protein